MIQQYLQIKSQVPDAILFFRMGDFYEMFFEDALEASKILDIALTSRNKGRGDESVPLCGIPYHACGQYMAKLVQARKRVAICEQVEDPKTAKTIVKREIIRIVTPGLPVGLESVLGSENIFLGVCLPSEEGMGLAFLDILTGDLKLLSESRMETILNHIQIHQPREIIVPPILSTKRPALADKLEKIALLTSFDGTDAVPPEKVDSLLKRISEQGQMEVGAGLSEVDSTTLRFLLSYLIWTKNDHLEHLKHLQLTTRRHFLRVDEFTRRNLEIFEPLSGKTRRATLVAVLDETQTPMGRRLLREWLRYPLQEVEEVNQRLDVVEAWRSDPKRRNRLQASLRNIADLERLMGRVTAERANARDLVQLKETLAKLPGIIEDIRDIPGALMDLIRADLDSMEELVSTLEKTLIETPPIGIREGGMIREGVSQELDELREIQSSGKSWMIRLEAKEQKRTGISSLKVRYNRVFGYYIEVTKANLHLVPEDYQRKQTLVNAERFVTPELKEMEEKVLSAEERIQQLEYSLFIALRDAVKAQALKIQEIAGALARLDVLISLAEIAHRYRYCRPEFTDDTRLWIRQGRHPVVEQINLQESFVPNDTLLDSEKHQIMLITGPNMAGKSTYIRQVALIALMAHIGSYVPAQEVKIGIIDQIFTRVGASDNLALGLSTFMVEMKEAASILANSTVRSLIVLDEIGRGTSTFDGLSIAWAIAEFLHDRFEVAGTKTLFATHYHELTDLARLKPRIHNWNVAVKEWNDEIIFLRKLDKGGMNRSYGIQVARLAGIPGAVILRAKEILHNLEQGELTETGIPTLSISRKVKGGNTAPAQLELFASRPSPVEEAIRKAPIEQMTPLEALNFLHRLQEELKEKN
jgi:DNA mismatch repair protein MutS